MLLIFFSFFSLAVAFLLLILLFFIWLEVFAPVLTDVIFALAVVVVLQVILFLLVRFVPLLKIFSAITPLLI